MARKFAVWNGTTIDPQYTSIAMIRDAVRALKPAGTWTMEWLPKAGEGGSWQANWDDHPLALDGFGKLLGLVQQGKALSPMLNVIPYVVIRGREEWQDAELHQIAECAVATGRVVLNLEEGAAYWNGPTDPDGVRAYLSAMWSHIGDAFGGDPAFKRVQIELAAIPRQWVVDALGGDDNDPAVASTFDAWAEGVTGMSWECYDAIAPDLDVAESMGRVYRWLGDTKRAANPMFRIPIVQRSRIGAWAETGYCAKGMEVWHLGGD